MDSKLAGGIGAILMLIASFTYVNIVNDNEGIPLEATHYCEARAIKSYCTGFTKYYGLEQGKCLNPKGNLLCRTGWVEIARGTEKPKTITCVKGGCK